MYTDRIPQGFDEDNFSTGSFYLQVRDGWVHVSEEAFPGFVGWVMELHDMEDVREWPRRIK